MRETVDPWFTNRDGTVAVGYRTNDLGIVGWVRNRADGSVEVWAQGTPDAIERMTTLLRSGPQGAVVDSVRVEEVEPDDDLEGFQIVF